jgi:Tfp pilus assembly protein PilF
LSLSKELHAAWHTLGVILLKTDRRDEARQSFERALEINENNVSAAIHLMKLSIEDGNRDSAAQLLAKWLPERERLPKDMHKELDRIEKALNK